MNEEKINKGANKREELSIEKISQNYYINKWL
jgi:hypothetical protein